jgi:hypothetical protein
LYRDTLVSGFFYDSSNGSYYLDSFYVTPDSGSPAGNQRRIVTTPGAWFIEPLRICVDGREADSVAVYTTDSLAFWTPLGLIGNRDVKIRNGSYDSIIMPGGYKYRMPVLPTRKQVKKGVVYSYSDSTGRYICPTPTY